MNSGILNNLWLRIALMALLTAGAVAAAMAEPPPGRHPFRDDRYHHRYYYPPRGLLVRELPLGYRPYAFHGSNLFFVGGVWYSSAPGGFVVVRPPVGLVVSELPPAYTTVWLGGVPYYYANEAYYRWNTAMNGYEVVDPPIGADQPQGTPTMGSEDVYIYPKNGQSSDQQTADRYECHRWASGQSGFDPTQSALGPADASKRDQYRRAMTACLDGRGYSVQ